MGEVRDVGLSSQEADRRLASVGPNILADGQGSPNVLAILLRQFVNPLLALLLLAAAAAWVFDHVLDAWIILGAVGVAVLLGFAQEFKAEGTLAALNGLVSPMAWVRRDGKRQQVPASHVVPKDTLLLSAGDKVPADATVVRAEDVEVSEASLTGESAAVGKQVGDPIFAGTVMLRGQAVALVTATGRSTKMGQIASLVTQTGEGPTPLEIKIIRFSRQLSILIALLAIALIWLSLAQGRPVDSTILTVISLAVALIPEGLPIMVTLVLAMGMEQLARKQATVRKMAAVETLGSVTVAAIDKTGTITTGQLAVVDVVGEDPPLVVSAALVASRVGSALIGTPDPLELAILAEAERRGQSVADLEQALPRIGGVPFDAQRRWMASIVKDRGRQTMFIKGAPEVLLPNCQLSITKRRIIERQVLEHSARGERVLLVAKAFETVLGNGLPKSLEYLGLIGFADPVRSSAREAVASLGDRGIRLLMITGDHPETARATAVQIGLTIGEHGLLTGVEMRKLTDDQLCQRLTHVAVCARILPDEKLRIVAALQRNGEVVAMTGDGVNDGPALKKADIGIALGKSGTEVAKETADLVLLDDELNTLVTAVDGGRKILATLEKGMVFLLGTNLAELGAVVVATAAGWPVPLAATQILWINLVADSVPVAGLAVEYHAPSQRPAQRRRALIDSFGWRRIIVMGVVMSAITLGLYWVVNPMLIHQGDVAVYAQTVAFSGLAIGQFVSILTVRSRREIRWPWEHVNPLLISTILGGIVLQVAVVYWAGSWLHVVPISALDWMLIGLSLLVAYILIECHKVVESRNRLRGTDRPLMEQAIDGVAQGLRHPWEYYRRWRYRNTALLLMSLIVFVYILDSTVVQQLLAEIGRLGYLGAFFAGIFFTSTFTIAPAGVVLFVLADSLSPYGVALLAGLGGVLGDYVILRILKDRVFEELTPLMMRYGGSFVTAIFRTPYFSWVLPFIGAAIIASPLPDEVGIGLLGLSKLKTWQFLVVTFVLNALGIFLIVSAARVI